VKSQDQKPGADYENVGIGFFVRRGSVNMRVVFACVLAALVASCASKSSEIAAAYVSPIPYQSYTCAQLATEAQAVSAKAVELSGVQDQKRTNDQIATGVAIVVFWPAAFMVGGDGQVAAQLAQLKGQMNAIEQANIHKRCGIQFQRQPVPQS
jgi:hypothetical protein